MGSVTQIRDSGRIVDLSQIDAGKILREHRLWESLYDCAAFDPLGHQARFYPGCMTVWSGFPGAGKTTLLRQTVCHLLARSKAVFIASLEEEHRGLLVRLAATAAGMEYPNEDHVAAFMSAYGCQLFVWEPIERITLAAILSRIRELRSGEGITHAVIDSLMCLDVANDDTEGQRYAALCIKAAAQESGCHIHLVAHPRKLISVKQEPDLNDVAGAREIGGIADTVLFVCRGDSTQIDTGASPMIVRIRKQRHFDGRIGDVSGWFHRKQKQFHVDQFAEATRYLPDWAFELGESL